MTLPPIKALGTVWHIELFETCRDHSALRNSIVDWLEVFESRYSRFRSDSWLSTLNQNGVFINPNHQLVDLLTQAREYYSATEGVFNIAVGEQLTQSGYDADYSFTAATKISSVPDLPDILDVKRDTILLKSGSLDLGGIGKGYAIDKLADFLKEEHGLRFFLINGGGDMYATSDNDKPITITLAHPDDQSLAIGTLDLQNVGFAASSPRLRTWRDPQTGSVYNHLLTKNNIASYVVAPTTTAADVWATVSCLNQDVQVPPNVHQLLIDRLGQIAKDTFVYLENKESYNLYKK